MELKVWLMFFTAINYCLDWKIVCARKNGLQQNNGALDNFGYGEADPLTKGIHKDREERELIKELNETLESLEISGGNATDTTHIQTNDSALMKHLNMIQKNQNEILKMVNDIISNQNDLADKDSDIINRVGVLQNTTNVLRDKYEKLEQELSIQGNELTTLANLSKSTQLQLQKVDSMSQNLMKIVSDTRKATYLATVTVKEEEIPYVEGCDAPNPGNCLDTRISTLYDHLKAVAEFKVILVGGSNNREGRVEIDYQERHGTVCDDNWSTNDARVVCRMLGFSGGMAFKGPVSSVGHRFGEGTGEILLDSVGCTGDEKSLFYCPHNGIGNHDCAHNEDAGIRCEP